ncbi:telomeric repeat binding factor a [Etheostoma spectabile]|uniref:telomeric repeat binding factor a n=1 Tax=Etheostoma spectabile TaxID=54343 RepID=UPI0013AEBA51|nr:telomeric repeat-binding factor 2-like [Etheostoma spectabile]
MVDIMAAKKIVNSYQTDVVESIVNRWIFDYYFSLLLERYDNKQFADVCGIIDILERVLDRPLEATNVIKTKIRILQFLTRIHNGENIGKSFNADKCVSPLESALIVLEQMSQDCSIPQQDFENVCASIKDMMVWMLINKNEFDRAAQVVNKHFPKPMVGKKAIFMSFIKKKSKMHDVEQINFLQFKKEMLAFCQSLCPSSVSFLHKAATHLFDEKLAAKNRTEPDEQEKAGPSFTLHINNKPFGPCKHTIIQRARLEAAYKALTAGSDEKTFAQLEEEVVEEEEQARIDNLCLRLSPSPRDTNQDLEQDELFQRDSGSPMEASQADQPPHTDANPQTQAGSLPKTTRVLRNRRLYTVAQLVAEPDSQGSSQCTTALQEMEIDVHTEEPPQSLAIPNRNDSQSPLTDDEVTIPVRKRPRPANKICSRASTCPAELSTESEEDPPGSVENGEISAAKRHNQSNSSLSGNSTKSEESSSDSEEDPQESPAPCKSPVQKPRKQLASKPLSKDPEIICIADSLDSSPNLFPPHPVPQTSSTPQKDSAQDTGPSSSKWKRLLKEAKETKETWSDEESYVSPRKKTGLRNESTISGNKKKMWSERETQKLKEGVKKFGEGNWSKIMAHYSFEDRTNVNLKDRWRTLKKMNQV